MKNTTQHLIVLAGIVAFGIPLFASAQSGINLGAITPYSNGIKNIINDVIVPVLMAIAFIVFLWGIYRYFILGAANESEKAEGRTFAMWGIIGFVIILSLWGLVGIVGNAFGLQFGGSGPTPPTIGGGSANNNSYFFGGQEP